ncbi:DUF885 domain-containing protein [Pseudoalteromonas denitrificans]|uniref:Uncharacterized conserved protein, DUF885 familyt n=1 Tax=Pseudoalteromonas denitrificans DSM 6059 TaxID=1123010 RepID=A0A1I1MDZ1_9GAMM|nr:DUF885 domain-containing protein [Pseudoalteromonas denitrificans]SFC83366.1 Uncharacterized conserved protein, DUF885 familyt [Pseudoalteromonas denitrificans DSM 6059]
MRKNTFIIGLLISFILGCNLTSKNHDKYFLQVAEQITDYRKSIDVYASEEGVNNLFLPDLSPDFLARKDQKLTIFLDNLAQIDIKKLTQDNQINLVILKRQLKNSLDEYHYNAHLIPLTSEYGFHSSMSFLISESDFSNKKGFDLYLKRLADIPRYFSENIFWMKKGIEIGVTQPKVALIGYEDSIKAFITKNTKESVFYEPFKENTAELNQAEFESLQHQAQRIITQQVIPAFENYNAFFTKAYFPSARNEIGVSAIKNGDLFYANRVKHYTTTDMSAQQIHELGLTEVARIRIEMQKVIEQVGFKGPFSEFVEFLRTDPQFYAETPEELLKEASFIAKKMDAQLPKFFHTLPRTPYGVAPVPDDIAPKYTTGRYIGPSRDDQAGFYWVNTYGLDKRPLYVLEALTLHEAVPGHHLQISLNSELKNLPSYRQDAYISAFGEGWGLYSEWLGLEAGFYQDPYSNFGRLTYEMWRAARLVVDTGMHMFGWSRERAMNFMKNNTALSLHNIQTETDRYISWPGQALSYKVGELTIKRLRVHAKQVLGDKFDLREFHHQILKNGSVPLFILEQQIYEYIELSQD